MPYSVTKAAQWQLVKCLATTVGPTIRVNTVLPGLLLTEWVRSPVCCCYYGHSLPNADYALGAQVFRGAHQSIEFGGSAEARSIHG